MSKVGFKSELEVRASRKSGCWVLLKKLVFIDPKDLKAYVAPKGFSTDLASIPRGLRWLISVNGKHRKAAVIHDYCYVRQYCTRKEADQVFLRAMKACGVSWWKRRAMYRAVRSAGWVYWRKQS